MNNKFYLFSKPSFLEGVARLVDFGATLNMYNDSSSPEEADINAIRSDWEIVGNDLQHSIDNFKGK